MRGGHNKTHGMSGDRVYRIWYDMKRRCKDHTRKAFKNYGGRGITYDPKWESFEGFWEDMSEGYHETLTLERVNVNEDYSKKNCCWITKSSQARNKRRYSNNKLGRANISIVRNKGVRTVKARIQDPVSGKRFCKFFSLGKYTEEEAMEKANWWLACQRTEFYYAGSHGS